MSIPKHVHIVILKIIVSANKKATTSCEMVAFLFGIMHERIQ